VSGMEKSTREYDEAGYLFAHRLINKLQVIVGNCDVLGVEVDAGSECAQRLTTIRDVAKEMGKEIVKEFQQDQCRPLEAIQSTAGQKHHVA
jgi:hypothetical protein